MLQVNIRQLVAAVQEADPFALPEMSEGTSYLYNNIYDRLSRGENVWLSDLDFDAFTSEDIGSLDYLHDNILGNNGFQADCIIKTLRKITPLCRAEVYV